MLLKLIFQLKSICDVHSKYLAFAILFGFAVSTWLYWNDSRGDDLSSGYFAARLLADGEEEEVYAHDPTFFHLVESERWRVEAEKVNFKEVRHPYVQVPLWAAMVQPLSTRLSFEAFNSIFVLVNACSIIGILCLCSRWLDIFGNRYLSLVLILIWLWFSHPFQYTMMVTQTQPIFLFATLAALVYSEEKKEWLSGFLLAFAAIVKITPGMLVLFWIFTGKWKAIIWFSIAFVLFMLLSILLAGWDLNLAFISEFKRISNILLVTWNNESLAAFVMGYSYPSELFDWRMLPLPLWLKYVGALLALITVTGAGWLRRLGADQGATFSIALVGITIFAPIAWSHYFILFMVPLTYFFGRTTNYLVLMGIVAFFVMFALNQSSSLFRPYFTASMILLVVCTVLSTLEIRKINS